MKKCLIRFDDICPTMDWEQFDKAMELMHKFKIKPLLGIVPDNNDPDLIIDSPRGDFWEKMRELQNNGFAIAMHGYHHVYDKKYPLTSVCGLKHSEFAGNSYANQYEKIKKGKALLNEHGIDTDVFFAPAHTYDTNTLKALRDNGFRYLSDGKASAPYKQYGIVCIPCRSTSVPIVGENGYYTAVCHPSEWRRPDKKNDYELLVEFCENYGKYIVGFDEMKTDPLQGIIEAKLNEKYYIVGSFIKRIFRKSKRLMGREREKFK